MRGVDLVRRVLVELDRRLSLEDRIFYLTRPEVAEIVESGGTVPRKLRERIVSRRERERIVRSISLPDFLTPADLDRVASDLSGSGAPEDAGEDRFRGTPLASGKGAGRAWICKDPRDASSVPPPRVLVCESIDPGWTPLLAQVQALVVERGGALSHGAIIARDFGVPAVVLPGATRILRHGESVEVDGRRGTVARLEGEVGPEGGGSVTRQGDGRAVRDARDDGAIPAREKGSAIPPEPYVAPAKPGLARAAVLSLVTAVVLSLGILLVPVIQAPLLLVVSLALDWTLVAGWSPFGSIALAAFLAAGAATVIAHAVSDRRRFRRMRQRLAWYRKQLRRVRKERPGPGRCEEPRRAARRSTLRLRYRQAAAERTLELLRPVGCSFLPFCLAFVWVEARFPSEPIRPGSTFTVRAYFRPAEGDGYLRYARLDSSPPGKVRLLDDPYQRLRPNRDAPHLGPYEAVWSLQALEPLPDDGTADQLLAVHVTSRNERVGKMALITSERKFAAPRERRVSRRDPQVAREITAVEVEPPPLRVRPPDAVHALLDRFVRWVTGGHGIRPGQVAFGPLATFLVLAILLALAMQRLTGLR